MDDTNEFLMTSSCSTIVDRKDHVQYLSVSKNAVQTAVHILG